MGIDISAEQKRRLKSGGSVLTGFDNALPRALYHYPETGREVELLSDSFNQQRYMEKGMRMGPAPAELREKWKVIEAENRAEDDRLEAVELAKQNQNSQVEGVDFNDAVTAAAEIAAKRILEKLGIDIPAEEETVPSTQDETEQLRLM